MGVRNIIQIPINLKVKEHCLPNYLPISRERIVGWILIPRESLICEIQTALSKVWTRVTVSISYYDNRCTTSTSLSLSISLSISLSRSLSPSLCICIYIYRERERERQRQSETERKRGRLIYRHENQNEEESDSQKICTVGPCVCIFDSLLFYPSIRFG